MFATLVLILVPDSTWTRLPMARGLRSPMARANSQLIPNTGVEIANALATREGKAFGGHER